MGAGTLGLTGLADKHLHGHRGWALADDVVGCQGHLVAPVFLQICKVDGDGSAGLEPLPPGGSCLHRMGQMGVPEEPQHRWALLPPRRCVCWVVTALRPAQPVWRTLAFKHVGVRADSTVSSRKDSVREATRSELRRQGQA